MGIDKNIYTEKLQKLIADVLADKSIGLITPGTALPDPECVLSGESEESITCYFALPGSAASSDRVIAVKHVASPESRARLWHAIEAERRAIGADRRGSHALLPVMGNSPDHEVFIYDDGTWILEVFSKLKLTDESTKLIGPQKILKLTDESTKLIGPEKILSGRAGLSRIYRFRLQQRHTSPTYIIKFNLPERSEREWNAIQEMRKRNWLRDVVQPLTENRPDHDVIVYESFAPNASRVLSFDQFLKEQIQNLDNVKECLNLLRRALQELYSESYPFSPGRPWKSRFPELNEILLSSEGCVGLLTDLGYMADRESKTWKVPRSIASVSIPNPLLAVQFRMETECGVTRQAQVHGDLQTSNLLIALAEQDRPDRLGIIDVEKLGDAPVVDDLALIEVDFLRMVFPELVSDLVPSARSQGLDNVTLKMLVFILSELSGLDVDSIDALSLSSSESKFARGVVHFLFRLREIARPYLRREGYDDADPRQYFHALLFHHLRSLRWSHPRKNPLRVQLALIGAALAEQTIQSIGEYGDGRIWRDWRDIESAITSRIDPFTQDSPQVRTVLRATASECNEIRFLGGLGHMDQGDYRKLIVRGRASDDRAELAQAFNYQISQTLQDQAGQLTNNSSLQRGTSESDRGESWPPVSLDERVREKCGSGQKGKIRALLLMDEPGGGKSTTVRHLAWRVACRKPPFESEERLPVYVRLRDWENSGHSAQELAAYLAHYRGRSDDWPSVGFWQQVVGDGKTTDGKLFLVLDGLDELGTSRAFAGELLEQCERWASQGNVILMTCRTRSLGAYKSRLGDFEILRVNGLDPEEIAQFVHNYPVRSTLDRTKLLGDLRHHPSLRQLIHYPFLLDVICYLALSDGLLPECRNELIHNVMKRLVVEDWKAFDWSNSYWGSYSSAALDLLQVIARASLILRVQESEGHSYNAFSFRQLERALRQALRLEQKPNLVHDVSLLMQFYCATRFLRLPCEPDLLEEPVGSFSHGLFLDFLAAEGLRLAIEPSERQSGWDTRLEYAPDDVSPRGLVGLKISDSTWFELLCFLPSRLRGGPQEFFAILCEGPDDLSRRRATLAIRCLGELSSKTLSDPSVKAWSEPIAQSCWEIAATHWKQGITPLAEALIAEISAMGRVHVRLIKTLADALGPDEPLQSRIDALTGLARIGTAAAQVDGVIEGLLQNLRHRNLAVRRLASTAMAKMGPIALSGLVNCARAAKEWYEQASVCEAIGLMGPGAQHEMGVRSCLIDLLVHPRPLVRASACEALGNLGPAIADVDDVIARLIDRAGASESDPTVRAQACTALGKYGERAASSTTVLSSLITSVADDDWVVRASASTALSDVGRDRHLDASHVLQGLRRLLQCETSEVRATACQAIGKLRSVYSSNADEVKNLLSRHVRDDNVEVTKCATEAIRNLELKIDDREVFSRLFKYLEDPAWQVRAAAVEALGNLRDSLVDEPELHLERLFALLKDRQWYVRAGSCEVLGYMASSAVAARPRIVSRLLEALDWAESQKFEEHVSIKALKALGKAGLRSPRFGTAVSRIGECLASAHWMVQVAACEALAELGPEASGVDRLVPELIECLKSTVWCVRANACKTLGQQLTTLVGKAQDVVEIVKCLFDPQEPVRIAAAEVLTRLAGAGKIARRFVVETQQKRLRVEAVGPSAHAPPIQLPFPKPTPTLLTLNLASPTRGPDGRTLHGVD